MLILDSSLRPNVCWEERHSKFRLLKNLCRIDSLDDNFTAFIHSRSIFSVLTAQRISPRKESHLVGNSFELTLAKRVSDRVVSVEARSAESP